MKKRLSLFLAFVLLLSLTACGGADTSTRTGEPERKVNYKVYEPRDYMRVHFLDVGQGDCTFICTKKEPIGSQCEALRK